MSNFRFSGAKMALVPALFFLAVLTACRCYCPSGRLPAREYLKQADEYGNVIPDFSHAGYMGGGVALPDVPVVKELSPEPEGCDRERLQAALDAVGEMPPDEDGFRGALLLRAGEYRVDGYLHIHESGVVLRGEGQHERGTLVRAMRRDYVLPGRRRQHSLIYLGKHDTSRVGFLKKETQRAMAGGRVPVGSREIELRTSEGFSPGDGIVIEVYTNENWVRTLGLEERWSGKARPGRTRFYYERQVEGIDGNTLILDAPMTFYLDDENFHGVAVWNYSEDGRITNSGVENLRLASYFTDDNYMNLENYRERSTHARNGVRVEAARDCWVRNLTALYFPHAAVKVQAGARNITIEDCAYLRPVSQVSGGMRYPFRVDGSHTLVQRCYARYARHAFTSSSAGLGLNVFLDCLAEKSFGPSGPHIKWAVGYLYDNVAEPLSSIEARKQPVPRSGHGWRGANHVFWNCEAAQMKCDEPETADTNWAIGVLASKRSSPERAKFGRWISHGNLVEPRSLYLWQLGQRLGREAVAAVTESYQLEGGSRGIYEKVKGELAELNRWEAANDENLLPDPGFRVIAARSPWRTTEDLEEPYEFDEYEGEMRLPGDDLERAENPVFGDDSAVAVPGDRSLRTMPFLFMDFKEPGSEQIRLELSFDYRAAEGAEIYGAVIKDTIRTGVDEEGYGLFTYGGKTNWEQTGVFEGPRKEGTGGWERYGFEFVLEPEMYGETNMPYPTLLVVNISAAGGFSIANPALEIRRGEYR